DCIFCRIANKEIKSDFIYEDEDIVVFNDVNPAAPVHLLVIPKKHISSIMEIGELKESVSARILKIISKVAKDMNIDEEGFRVVSNTGDGAGQSVAHLHFHILGGRKFNWPPG
ncbi:MAG TPA: histidine triad nucleotide-binding protein, partial [Candidatus Humimicrobiaceae bacterium]